MSLEITVYASDVKELDETITRAFDIRHGWGSKAVNDDSTMATFDELGFEFPDGSVQAVLQRQQELINKMDEVINRLDGAMSLIYERNRKLEHEVLHLKVALHDSAKVFGKIKLGEK
jgi:hypothetical protein